MGVLRFLLSLLTLVGLLSYPARGHAVCTQSFFSSSDQLIWDNHGFCNAFAPNGTTWFPTWAVSDANYHVSSSDGWSNRGWNDACNLNMEFTKLWNSFYLIQNGILNDNSNSWHGIEDYPFVAQGNGSTFHDEFFFKAIDGNGVAHFHPNFWGDDEVVLWCGSFDEGSFGDGVVRAMTIVHEGWHAWQRARGITINHLDTAGRDFFYVHAISDFPFGAMHDQAIKKHTATQAEYEFGCDLYISSQPWVPNDVKMAAAAEANGHADWKFVNPATGGPLFPPYCDAPRPWTLP